MTKPKIKVVAGIPLKDLPTKAMMIYVLDGFYHRYGTAETVKACKSLTKAQLAVVYLKCVRFMEQHAEEPPSAEVMATVMDEALQELKWAQ